MIKHWVYCFLSGGFAFAEGPSATSPKDSVTNEATSSECSATNGALARLQAFEKGELSLESITENPRDAEMLLRYYAAGTNELTTKQKLPVSRVLAMAENCEAAAQLAEDYVEVYSNDWRGWRLVGTANALLGHDKKALAGACLACARGDTNGLPSLVALAVKVNRMDIARAVIRPLRNYKDSMPKHTREYDEAVMALAMYARLAENEKLFLKALEGVPISNIVSRADLKAVVGGGCKQFDNEESRRLLKKMSEFKKADLLAPVEAELRKRPTGSKVYGVRARRHDSLGWAHMRGEPLHP